MKPYDISHPVHSSLLCFIINFVFVLEIIFLMNSIHLYYLNWSFFPGIFLLHISSKPMCGCRHSIEMQVTSSLYCEDHIILHSRSDCFDTVFRSFYLYLENSKNILRFLGTSVSSHNVLTSRVGVPID